MSFDLLVIGDAVDVGLDLAGVLLSSTAIGSGAGITAAVLRRRTLATVELWGFRGTAFGFAVGAFLTACTLAAR